MILRSPRVLTTGVALGFVLLGSALSADTIHRSFDVAPGGTLEIDTDRGAIEVRTSRSDRVEIEVVREGNDAQKLELDFSQRGQTIVVEGDYPETKNWSFFNWFSSQKILFRVTVPERFDVDLQTSGGSIEVDDLEGSVRAATSGGSLSFGNIDGPVWGRTSGGSISLRGGGGDADIRTSGGSITVGDVDGTVHAETSGGSIHIDRARGSVHAETSGGGIEVNEVMGQITASTSGGSVHAAITTQPTGDCRLTTSGGGVYVDIAPGIGLDVDAKSSGGRVTSEVEVDDASRSRTSLRGTIGGGGPSLYLRTSGGGVRIDRG